MTNFLSKIFLIEEGHHRTHPRGVWEARQVSPVLQWQINRIQPSEQSGGAPPLRQLLSWCSPVLVVTGPEPTQSQNSTLLQTQECRRLVTVV